MSTIPVIVLGGSGYVAGEFLRLIAQHPKLHLGAAVSTSASGEPIDSAFGHLSPSYAHQRFVSIEAAVEQLPNSPRWVVVSAAPHGASAALIERVLLGAESAGVEVSAVDASADFRFRSSAEYEAIYSTPHGAPAQLESFRCAVPEHLTEIDTPHMAQPGCFASAMLLGIVPLAASGLTEPDYCVSAVTGSTGAGGTPRETTHHPVRQSNLFAYQPLTHRHVPEVRTLTEAATGQSIGLHFVPHSGPFARGIHVTLQARAEAPVSAEQLRKVYEDAYANAPFVQVVDGTPRIKNVVASNQCHIGVATGGDTVVVMAVIDNLVKGAAGGAVQWMNRLWGLPETSGLDMPAPGWT